jgi:AcrR family transcriptional regulator
MPRWPEDTRERLVDAALTLFTEHGYTAVTVDDIAARAEVSSRTFFRHFPDKEEVLFADDDDLLPVLLGAILGASGSMRAEEHMRIALSALVETLEPERSLLRRRQRIIDSQVSLTGRELAKQAQWQQSVMATLVEVGYAADDADLLSAIGFAVFRRALHSWLADGSPLTLSERVDRAIAGVRSVLDVVPSPSARGTSARIDVSR